MTPLRLFSLSAIPLALALACGDGGFATCEDTRTCEPGDGDGDTSSGGTGDGDGDGDTGGSGDGDGDTGGTGTGGGDGDGDNTGGMGGDPNDPCLECGPDEYCNAADECVQCLNDNHCDADDAPVCDPATFTCVGCIDESDCEDPALPMCDGNTCAAGCTGPADCERFADTSVCDDAAGECVQCLPSEDDRESDTDTCGTNVCNPLTLECESTLTQNTQDTCSPCIADSECLVGQNCIPLQYTGGSEPVDLGGFCMKLFPGCTRPFAAGAINRESLSGAPAADYCGIAEESTTCAAIADLKTDETCITPADCGTEHGEARCEIVNGSAETKCTYACTSSNQCVAGNDCDGLVGSEYCGG